MADDLTFDDALRWVKDNKNVAARWYNKFRQYTPYGLDDFESEVSEAALIATLVANSKGINFEAAFVISLQKKMKDLVPGYGVGDFDNRSVGPGDYCYDMKKEIEVTLSNERPVDEIIDAVIPSVDLVDHAYQLVDPHLNDQQRMVLSHAVGIGHATGLSLRQLEVVIGIKKSTSHRHLTKLFNEVIPELVSSGTIRPYIPISFQRGRA